jgi:hypothetical protein
VGRYAVWSHARQSLSVLGGDDMFAAVLGPQVRGRTRLSWRAR